VKVRNSAVLLRMRTEFGVFFLGMGGGFLVMAWAKGVVWWF
jgi:hypothetical protein